MGDFWYRGEELNGRVRLVRQWRGLEVGGDGVNGVYREEEFRRDLYVSESDGGDM